MGEKRRFQIRVQREPLSEIEGGDAEGIRGLILERSSREVVLTGACAPRLYFAYDALLEEAPLPDEIDPESAPLWASTFVELASRDGVRQSFRVGELHESREDGPRRRVLAVLHLANPSARTWSLHWHHFGTGKASVGVPHGTWQRLEGQGADALPRWARRWLDTGRAEVEQISERTEPSGQGSDLRMAIAEFPHELPLDGCAIARWIGDQVDEELLGEPPFLFLAFAFRPGTVERWEIRGRFTCSLDDLMRSIAQQGETLAMALIHPCIVEMEDGERLRGIATVVHRAGHKARRVLPLAQRGDSVVPMDPLFQGEEPLPEGTGWIGVPPSQDIGLHVDEDQEIGES